jgi:hypothetical protein
VEHRGSPRNQTSIDKALEVCEVLSGHPRGMSLSELARVLRHPPSTVHRLLRLLHRRGYVRQDDETQRYALTLKMLDLSFRSLGRSELRLHAYPLMREYVLRTPYRGFLAIPSTGEVTYLWSAGPDEVAMRTVVGKEMPGHCALYFSPRQATRRLSCLKLVSANSVARPDEIVVRLGPWSPTPCSGCSARAPRCVTMPVRRWRVSVCSGTGPTTIRS